MPDEAELIGGPEHRVIRLVAYELAWPAWFAQERARIAAALGPVAFRDWLRVDPDDRTAYQALKRELATRGWADMNAYAAAKGPLITAITARAQAWAIASGWAPDRS